MKKKMDTVFHKGLHTEWHRKYQISGFVLFFLTHTHAHTQSLIYQYNLFICYFSGHSRSTPKAGSKKTNVKQDMKTELETV